MNAQRATLQDAESHEVADGRTTLGRDRDARDAARPAVAHSRDRSLVERCSGRCVLELTNTADPLDELGLVVLDTTTQMGQLEMRVAIDQTRYEDVVWKFKCSSGLGNGDTGMVVHCSNPPARIHENAAVLDGRRRDGMHPPSPDPEHLVLTP